MNKRALHFIDNELAMKKKKSPKLLVDNKSMEDYKSLQSFFFLVCKKIYVTYWFSGEKKIPWQKCGHAE